MHLEAIATTIHSSILQGLILCGEYLARSSEIISLNTFIFPTNVEFVVGMECHAFLGRPRLPWFLPTVGVAACT